MELVESTTLVLTVVLAVFTLTVWTAVLYALYSAGNLRKLIGRSLENPSSWRAEDAARFVRDFFGGEGWANPVKPPKPSRRGRR